MYTHFFILFLFTFASRALSFNITVNNRNLTVSQILDVPNSVVKANCASTCDSASRQLQSCNDDATCLCRADMVASLQKCEQCMFEQLIAVNVRMDFRVGSQAVLSAYASACKTVAKITLAANQTALALPPNWDGPSAAVLPVGGMVVTVMTGAVLGFSALMILSNM